MFLMAGHANGCRCDQAGGRKFYGGIFRLARPSIGKFFHGHLYNRTGMGSHLNSTQPIRLWFRISRYSDKTLGDKIRKHRLENGLKQVELAKKLGVNEMTIVNWELGRTVPNCQRLKAWLSRTLE